MTGKMGSVLKALKAITVEPVMLVDGACNQAMLLFIENVQMNKICSVNLGFSDEVCNNLSDHPEEDVLVQRDFSVFAFYNSVVLSVISLVFVLFMGAWSDKYGRKIPLLTTLIGHTIHAGGYLLCNWQTSWPVEVIYFVTAFDGLGGSNVGLLTTVTSYISDISNEKSRTSRVSTANSLWYLGGPLGTLVGALVLKYGGYNLALALVLAAYIGTVLYVAFVLQESHGPFASKSLQARGSFKEETRSQEAQQVSALRMAKDFFNWRRVVESFKTAFRKREGNTRMVLMAIIVCNMLRRIARGFLMYMFVRRVLSWEATDYGYWITYRNLLAAVGSLFLVPLLTKTLSTTDASLAVMGALSVVGEYISYSLVSNPSVAFLMWLGPPIGILANGCVIAFRSMSTKLVGKEEKGRIGAVMGAMNGLMPMVSYAAYSPIYYTTVKTFPAAQFFFGASLNVVIMMAFIAIQVSNIWSARHAKDLEVGENLDKELMRKFKNSQMNVSLKSVVRTVSLLASENLSKVENAVKPQVENRPANEMEISGDAKEKKKEEGERVDKGIEEDESKEGKKPIEDDGKTQSIRIDESQDQEKDGSVYNEEKSSEKSSCRNRMKSESSGCYSNAMTDSEITASEDKQRR